MVDTKIDNKHEFDAEAVRAKYQQERDKRLRADANDQYLDTKSGKFASFGKDCWAGPVQNREPVVEEVDVLVVGAGFGGILSGVKLRKAGVDNIRIIDKAGGFGGVWYWNRYPGISCDTESYVYLPMLEETGYMPSRKYVFGQEIRQYAESIVDQFELRDKALFQTKVVGMEWDNDSGRWVTRTDRGDIVKARFVIHANGPIDVLKLPAIHGISDYKGHCFHSSRWDYAYTGGTEHDHDLYKLKDKRVAVIGTACSALQLIPYVAKHAKELLVFQRTPYAVDRRNNQDTDENWFKNQPEGWHKNRVENFTQVTAGIYSEEDLVQDGWTDLARKVQGATPTGEIEFNHTEELDAIIEETDFQKMEEIRDLVSEIVKDPETAESLKPYYRRWCKRPGFSDEYLQVFNKDNVKLVDTQGKGVTHMVEDGIEFDGTVYDIDCVIFASGYEVGTEHNSRTGYDPVGRGGLKLSEKFKDGWKSFYATQSTQFPNSLILALQQSGASANFMHTLDEQSTHATYIAAAALKRGVKSIEPEQAAEDEWTDEINRNKDANREFLEACTPSYLNNEGKVGERTDHNIAAVQYAGGPLEFFRRVKEWRDEDELRGMKIEYLDAK